MSKETQTDLWSMVQDNLNYLVSTREYLHKNPELSGQEFNTARFIVNELKKFEVEDIKEIATTGVTGLIKGALPGPVVLLRADIDALPVEEKAPVAYQSKQNGVMHACGHDGHTASLLGVAKILMANRHLLKGTIKLAFQPAEEGEGGARRMIDEGILTNPKVDYAFAFHVSGFLDEGKIGIKRGGIWSSCDDLLIKLQGKGGHSSQPRLCINPVLSGTEVIQQMSRYMVEHYDETEGDTLAFCQFVSGKACNIIPDTAEIKGSLRSYKKEMRIQVLKELEQCLKQVTASYGGSYVLENHFFSPVCFNDEQLTKQMTQLLSKYYGKDALVFMEEAMSGSEDFAFFSQEVPSFYFMSGIRKDKDMVLHSPDFQWDSTALQYSSWAMLNIACHLTEFVE